MCFLYSTARGQELHFSQTSFVAMHYNPAQTGNFNEHWRGTLQHRNQAFSLEHPYLTEMALFEHQLYWGIKRFSVGGWLANDQAGIAQLNSTLANVSFAYHHNAGAYGLHYGGGLSFVHRSLNPDRLSFPDQFDIATGSFNPSMATKELVYQDRYSYLSLKLGALVNRQLTTRIAMELGVAAHHINQPTVGFAHNTRHRLPAFVAHGQLQFSNTAGTGILMPMLHYYRSAQQHETLIGSEYALLTKNTEQKLKQLKAGLLLRTGTNRPTDALVFNTGVRFARFSMGLSMDFSLMQLTGKTFEPTTYEIGLSYNGPLFYVADLPVECVPW